MSRWDCLKEDARPASRTHRSLRLTTKSQKSKANISNNFRTDLVKQEFDRCLSQCRKEKRDESNSALQTLASLLLSYGQTNLLSSDDVVQSAVNGVLLLFLQSSISCLPDDNDTVRTEISIFDCLSSLLEESSKHKNALLAPLIEDISASGKEQQLSNPVRLQLFRVLQRRLQFYCSGSSSSSSSEDAKRQQLLCSTCRCLTTALMSAKTIDGTSRHAPNEYLPTGDRDVDAAIVARFVLTRDDQNRDRPQWAVALLLAYLQRHPDASASMASKLLFPRLCKDCLPFLETLRFDAPINNNNNNNNNGSKQVVDTVSCLDIMLRNLPYQTWFPDNHRSQTSSTGTHSSATFQGSVLTGLNGVILCTNRLVQQSAVRNTDIGSALTRLGQTLLVHLPLAKLPHLHEGCVTLCASLASCVVDPEKVADSNAAFSKQSVEALVEAFGGRLTPQGTTTKMSVCAKQWLESMDGFVFVSTILAKASGDSGCNRLLSALLRSFPALLIENEQHQMKLRTELSKMVTDDANNYVKKGYQWMEAVFYGRRNGEFPSDNTELLPFLVDSLELGFRHSTCRESICRAYSFFLPVDWRFVVQRDEASLLRIFDFLLLTCTRQGMDNSNKVKAAALKSAGEALSNLLTCDDPSIQVHVGAFINQLFSACCDASCDSHVSVRCMSVFAVGNTAHSLQGRIIPEMVHAKVLVACTNTCYSLLDDSDDKVVGNAIRTVGHLVCLALDDSYGSLFVEGGLDLPRFLDNLLNMFKERIRMVLRIHGLLNEEKATTTEHLTWSQRSSRRKHACGACNALADFFRMGIFERNSKRCEDAVVTLVQCVLSYRILNAKVISAALRALSAIPSEKKGTWTVDVTICCLAAIAEDQNEKVVNVSRVVGEFEVTLRSLLKGIPGTYAGDIFRKCTPEEAGILVGLLDEQEHGDILEMFITSSLFAELNVESSAERKLLSYAMMRQCENDDSDDEL